MADVQPLNLERHRQKPESNYHFWLNAALHLCITVLLIVDVGLQQWFHFCYFDYGLVTAKTWKRGIEDRLNGNSYSAIDEALCEGYKEVIEAACRDFCSTLSHVWSAGIVMIVFAVMCMLLTILYAVLHILMARGRRYLSWTLYVRDMQYGIWTTPMLVLIAVTLFIAVSGVYGVDNPWGGDQDVSTGSGLNLAYSIIVFSLVPSLHCYLFTSSYLIGRV